MSAEPLQIEDTTFAITRMIEQAPKETLVREFFMNAQESAARAPEGQRKVRIYPTLIDGVRKLTFWNTGPGMDADDLKSAMNLSSSNNKKLALDGNFGIGAKVSGLAVNRAGIRYRSCKDETVHEVVIRHDGKTYVRDMVVDVTDTVREEDMHDTRHDWTEAVLMGEADDHDTVQWPVGRDKKVERSYVTAQIFRRFATFLPGVEVRVDVAMTRSGGKGETGKERPLKLLSDVIPILPKAEKVTCPKTGVTVQYIHDPRYQSQTMSARKNPTTPSTTFCALVHKGERYDFKTKQSWSVAAPNFGIPFGSKVLTVEIILPDDHALPNQYRTGLTRPGDKSDLSTIDYAATVRELMPEWVREVIRQASPRSDETLEDIHADLQKLFDELKVPTTAFAPDKTSPDRIESADEGARDSEKADADSPDEEDDSDDSEKNSPDTDHKTRRAKEKRAKKAENGKRRAKEKRVRERPPDIDILDTDEQVKAKEIMGRAGVYYKKPHRLFVNGLYSAVYRMEAELHHDFAGQGDDSEALREIILKTARNFAALRVGKAVVYALSKRLVEDWTDEDVDKATTPESLSMAADDYRQSMNKARKRIKDELKKAAVG